MTSRTFMIIAVVAASMLALGGGSAANAQELLHGLPAYDSGWVDFPSDNEELLSHELGGDPGDYVVDLQVRDLVDGHGGGSRVHQKGLGIDVNDSIWWEKLTSHQIQVFRAGAATSVDQFRVRIWVVSDADYDSGWLTFDPGQDIKWLTHNLGGAVDDYVVDLQFNDLESRGCHIYGYGRDQWASSTRGAAWLRLGTSQVAVARGEEDDLVDSFRLRIFRRSNPSYDSGWSPMSGASQQFMHTLGGPWNDYVVDLQFRDVDDDFGVNQIGYGGDERWDFVLVGSYGAYWSELTSRSVRVFRQPDNIWADEVRVRIWESRRPKWDSGWLEISQAVGYQLFHGLGGDPDTFVVDLQFQCTDGCWFGTTQNGYGMNHVYDSDGGVLEQRGAGWYDLTSSHITVVRANADEVAHRVRARLWIAPEPELDLGWYDPQGQTGLFPFDVSTVPGYASDWVVDLQGSDAGTASWGRNQMVYGTDNYTSDGVSYYRVGLAWTRLDSSSITVERAANDSVNARFRLRIWHNFAFDYASTWQAISSVRTFSHNSGVDPDDLVLDMHFKDLDLEAIHNLYVGGDQSATGVSDRQGASWFALGSSAVSVAREPDDLLVDSVRMRVWYAPDAPNVIFHDDFESGDTSAW